MNLNRTSWLLAVVAVIATSTALYFGTGLHPVWWLAWIAPVPVLLMVARASGKLAFVGALIASVSGSLNLWHYLRGVLGLPIGIVLIITVLPALPFAVDVLLYRWALRKSLWLAALIFPSFWVFCEFVAESTSIHGTFGNISYSQMNFLPILQLASVTGIWGISFCVFLFAATVSALLSGHNVRGRNDKRVPAVVV